MAKESPRRKSVMARLAIVVEGLTEKNFINKIIRPHLRKHVIETTAVNLQGGVSLPQLKKHIVRLVHNFCFVSTMVDYYGFRGRGNMSAEDIECKIKTSAGTVRDKVTPYVQRHEFEALMFADKNTIADHLHLNPSQRRQLEEISSSPEEINHSQPPSKRLKQICSRYQKPLDGLAIAQQIGLPVMMRECPRFAEWVQKLQRLGGITNSNP